MEYYDKGMQIKKIKVLKGFMGVEFNRQMCFKKIKSYCMFLGFGNFKI